MRRHQPSTYVQVFILTNFSEEESNTLNHLQSMSTTLLANESLYCIILFPLCEPLSDMLYLIKSLIIIYFTYKDPPKKKILSVYSPSELIGDQFLKYDYRKN